MIARASRKSDLRRFAPTSRGIWIESRADRGAKHGQILAQVEHPSEFPNGFVPGGDFVSGSRREQPACEKVFTSARSSRRTAAQRASLCRTNRDLRNRAWLGLRNRSPVSPVPSIFPYPPAVFQACQAALVELDGALGALQALHHAGMHNNQYSQRRQSAAAATTPRSRPPRRPRKPPALRQFRRPAGRCRCGGTAFPGSWDARRRSSMRAWYSAKGLTMLG